MIFPIPKSKYKILREIYSNPGISISQLCKNAKVSTSVCYSHIKSLIKAEVVKERLIGKKPQIRQIFPNLRSENGRLVFSLIENQKRMEFFRRYENLKGCFLHLISSLPKHVLCVLVFGSYARFSATEESDLDILFLVSRKQNLSGLEDTIEEAFITSNIHISAKVMDERSFIKSRNDALITSIINEHVCIFNSMKFLDILGKLH